MVIRGGIIGAIFTIKWRLKTHPGQTAGVQLRSNMEIMEITDLKEQWRASFNDPNRGGRPDSREALQERVDILHRLNELGETDVNGLPIIEALEETNASIRKVDRQSH